MIEINFIRTSSYIPPVYGVINNHLAKVYVDRINNNNIVTKKFIKNLMYRDKIIKKDIIYYNLNNKYINKTDSKINLEITFKNLNNSLKIKETFWIVDEADHSYDVILSASTQKENKLLIDDEDYLSFKQILNKEEVNYVQIAPPITLYSEEIFNKIYFKEENKEKEEPKENIKINQNSINTENKNNLSLNKEGANKYNGNTKAKINQINKTKINSKEHAIMNKNNSNDKQKAKLKKIKINNKQQYFKNIFWNYYIINLYSKVSRNTINQYKNNKHYENILIFNKMKLINQYFKQTFYKKKKNFFLFHKYK